MYLGKKSHHDMQAIHVGWTNVANICVDNYNELNDKLKMEKGKIGINIITKKACIVNSDSSLLHKYNIT